MGQLTIPISGTCYGITSTIPRISLQRRLVQKFSIHYSDYCRQRLTPRNPQTIVTNIEFFTVPHVFLLESAGIWSILGIPRNGILAVLHAKIAISGPRNSGGFRNGHGITKTESTGTESPEFF